MIGIDLFAGAGGLSYGLSEAGFDMKIGIDSNPFAAETLQKNNTEMNVILSDIKDINPIKLIKQMDIDKEEIAIVAGGPPCQGFSQSNKRTRNLHNPLNNLYKEYFRFVKALQPEVFLFENVAGLMTLNQGKVVNDILNITKKLGYKTQHDVLNAEDFGIPQKRKRIFFIGTKKKASNFFLHEMNGINTVRHAIDDLPILENGNDIDELHYSRNNKLFDYQKMMRNNGRRVIQNNLVSRNNDLVIKRYKYIPQGGNWTNIPQNLMFNYKNTCNCHGWIYYRLVYDDSSVVINNYRKNMLIHPEQNRGLSVREAARLQSFSDKYVFYGKLGSQQQQVANAVPPLLAKEIGKRIMNYLGDYND
jgi:DNA (cytosine-5)-methyltransferase 1